MMLGKVKHLRYALQLFCSICCNHCSGLVGTGSNNSARPLPRSFALTCISILSRQSLKLNCLIQLQAGRRV